MEQELIRLAQLGDRTALEQLISRYSVRMYRAALHLLRNAEDAADVTQEACYKAIRSLSRVDPTRPIYPWLHTIVRNLAFNHQTRVRGRTVQAEDYHLPPSPYIEPEAAYLQDEEIQRVHTALAKLSEQHREIIELKHYQNCTYDEMAIILDIPVGTVMSRLFNARKALKGFIEEDDT